MRESHIGPLPELATAVVVHKAHSMWNCLGGFADLRVTTRWGPAVVLSLGCHAAGVDEGCPSVASRMLARGAVAFTGASRSPYAAATYWDVAFFTQLLLHGKSVGEANEAAFNHFQVQRADGGPSCLYLLANRLVLGDPALVPFPEATVEHGTAAGQPAHPTAQRITPAPQVRVSVVPGAPSANRHTVVVDFAGAWALVPTVEDQLTEWHTVQRPLLVPTALGCAPETVWSDRKLNTEEPTYTVDLPITPDAAVESVVVVDGDATGFSGKVFVRPGRGNHRGRVFWRVKMLDFDDQSGTVRRQTDHLTFAVTFSRGGFAPSSLEHKQ